MAIIGCMASYLIALTRAILLTVKIPSDTTSQQLHCISGAVVRYENDPTLVYVIGVSGFRIFLMKFYGILIPPVLHLQAKKLSLNSLDHSRWLIQ